MITGSGGPGAPARGFRLPAMVTSGENGHVRTDIDDPPSEFRYSRLGNQRVLNGLPCRCL
jgi:hypothetical protein